MPIYSRSGDLGPGVGETAAGDGVRVQGRPGSELPVAVLADGDGHAALRVGLGVGGHPPPARVRVVVRDLAAPPPPPLGLDEGGHRHGEELEAAGAALGLAVLRGGGAVLLLKRLHFWRIFLLLTLALRRKVVLFTTITTGLGKCWAKCLPDCMQAKLCSHAPPPRSRSSSRGGRRSGRGAGCCCCCRAVPAASACRGRAC